MTWEMVLGDEHARLKDGTVLRLVKSQHPIVWHLQLLTKDGFTNLRSHKVRMVEGDVPQTNKNTLAALAEIKSYAEWLYPEK